MVSYSTSEIIQDPCLVDTRGDFPFRFIFDDCAMSLGERPLKHHVHFFTCLPLIGNYFTTHATCTTAPPNSIRHIRPHSSFAPATLPYESTTTLPRRNTPQHLPCPTSSTTGPQSASPPPPASRSSSTASKPRPSVPKCACISRRDAIT